MLRFLPPNVQRWSFASPRLLQQHGNSGKSTATKIHSKYCGDEFILRMKHLGSLPAAGPSTQQCAGKQSVHAKSISLQGRVHGDWFPSHFSTSSCPWNIYLILNIFALTFMFGSSISNCQFIVISSNDVLKKHSHMKVRLRSSRLFRSHTRDFLHVTNIPGTIPLTMAVLDHVTGRLIEWNEFLSSCFDLSTFVF